MSASGQWADAGRIPRRLGGRGRWLSAFALLVWWWSAGAAGAAPLPFSGSLALLIDSFGIGVGGAGTAEVDGFGHLGSWQLGEGAFATSGLVVPITTPTAAPIGGFVVTARNGAGSFERSRGGVMPILGSVKVCLFGSCDSAVANLTVPLSVVGVGGVATVEGLGNVTVVGAPWTTGTASVGTATAVGYARGPNGETSSTARPSGEIQLVTPIRIYTNLSSATGAITAFAVLNLHFVPEPTTLVLLGAGLVATAVFGRRARS